MHMESAKEEAHTTSCQGRAKVKHLTAWEPDAFVASLCII